MYVYVYVKLVLQAEKNFLSRLSRQKIGSVAAKPTESWVAAKPAESLVATKSTKLLFNKSSIFINNGHLDPKN